MGRGHLGLVLKDGLCRVGALRLQEQAMEWRSVVTNSSAVEGGIIDDIAAQARQEEALRGAERVRARKQFLGHGHHARIL